MILERRLKYEIGPVPQGHGPSGIKWDPLRRTRPIHHNHSPLDRVCAEQHDNLHGSQSSYGIEQAQDVAGRINSFGEPAITIVILDHSWAPQYGPFSLRDQYPDSPISIERPAQANIGGYWKYTIRSPTMRIAFSYSVPEPPTSPEILPSPIYAIGRRNKVSWFKGLTDIASINSLLTA